ncbi:hypothetical protein [Chryseolinea sp. H1M3-3]|uniref:hypothetical protein n=1 Tax=Chryseolinea sp. H1M3-3 TaxID=3034144 RepID=UPI0023ECDBBB|nr:hypothetical protein [Chryseolinea sp. H1M3-3]
MNTIKSFFTALLFASSIIACTETRREAEKNLDILMKKALTLDSVINVESKKIKLLDSAMSGELSKANKLDSLVNHESKRIDSLLIKIYRKIERQN